MAYSPPVGAAAAGPTLSAQGGAERRGQAWLARADLSLDAVRFADLASYWPETLAPNVRQWITRNIMIATAMQGLEVP